MLHVSVSAYKQEGLVCVPEGGVTVVECTISTRVDGDVLKVFWSYCSEVGFIKVPRDNKSCIWVITPEQCHRLIDSMPRRIAAVIRAKGAPTKY